MQHRSGLTLVLLIHFGFWSVISYSGLFNILLTEIQCFIIDISDKPFLKTANSYHLFPLLMFLDETWIDILSQEPFQSLISYLPLGGMWRREFAHLFILYRGTFHNSIHINLERLLINLK
jgi:hypothetical protein